MDGKKFAGVGLGNVFIIWLCCMVFSIAAKIIAARYPVKGLSETVMVGA